MTPATSRSKRVEGRGLGKNLGPKSTSWLSAVGIKTLEDLAAVGAVEAYRRCRLAGYPTSLNLLWALAGALLDIPWNELPPEVKEDLSRQVDA